MSARSLANQDLILHDLTVTGTLYVNATQNQETDLDLENLTVSQSTDLNTLNCSGNVLIATNEGKGANISFEVKDLQTGDGVAIIPCASVGNYNPCVQNNDMVVLGDDTESGTSTLCLTSWSNTNSGVRITPSQVIMGSGGIDNTPASSITSTGTSIEITPSAVVNGNATIYGDMTLSGSLSCTGASIDINSASVVNGEATIEGDLNISQNITPTGVLTLGGDANLQSNLNVSGTTTINNNATIQANLTIGGTTNMQDCNGNNLVCNQITCNTINASNLQTGMMLGEVVFVQITGNGSTATGTVAITNTTQTNNYTVYPSIYYGYTGSGGTYDAVDTAGAFSQIVISNRTTANFQYSTQKTTGQNVNVYIQFLVVYTPSACPPASYSS